MTLETIALKFHSPSNSPTSTHEKERVSSSSNSSQNIINRIYYSIDQLYKKFLTPDGMGFRYQQAGTDVLFQNYLKEVSQLKCIQIRELSNDERTCFFLNIYNSLVIHHLILNPESVKSWMKRLKFYSSASYNVGGYDFSLNHIEHGILRANRRLPCWFGPILSKSDIRALFACDSLDPRLHFAINCGAHSCGAVRRYNPETIHEQLDKATKDFLLNPENFNLDIEKRMIKISLLFWFLQKDFGSSKQDAVRWCIPYLSAEQRSKLKNLLDSGNYSIEYLKYDWSLNDAV